MINRKKILPIIIVTFSITVVITLITYYSSNQTKNTSLVRKPSSKKAIELKPSDFDEKASGCGDFIVYKYSKDGGLSVKVNSGNFQVTEKPITLDIQSTNDIEIVYAEGENLFETMPTLFCNDYTNPKIAKPKVWTATSGTVTISNLGGSEKSLSGFNEYYVRVALEDIYFIDGDGKNPMNLSQLVFEKVLVGWYPG